VEARRDGRGYPYYWIGFQRSKMEPEEGTDLHAIGNAQISITPLKLDLTDERALARLANAFA
jgi:5'-nucleotidase